MVLFPKHAIETTCSRPSVGASTERLTALSDTLDKRSAKSFRIEYLKRLFVCAIALHVSQAFAETTWVVPLVPSASETAREGFLRVINHSAASGEVEIVAIDDSGRAKNPITLTMNGRQTVHFDSDDLENGDDGDILSSGVGSGEGDWRLELKSELDIEVLAYVRTNGFLTAMHDSIPEVENTYEVAIFNPASDREQLSSLRLVNLSESEATISISGIDSTGSASSDSVEINLDAGAARSVTASDIESEGFGMGDEKWRLTVESDRPLIAVNLMESSTGHLVNLSSTVAARRVPLFPAASNRGFHGIVRLLNRSDESGEISIAAFDSTGEAFDPLTLRIEGGETVYFDSEDLEQGNAEIGLSTGTGSGTGDWHLEFESELDIEVLAYLNADNGFFTPIHDLATGTAYRSRIPTHISESDSDEFSVLRVVNVGESSADVRVQGIDDEGLWSSVVQVTIPAGASRELGTEQMESGDENVAGMLGEGIGNWQLIVRSDQPVLVTSLMKSADGYISGLSSVPLDRSTKSFEHDQAFARVEEDRFHSSERLFDSHRWYRVNYEFAKYVGFQDMLKEHDYRVPTGRGLTILQGEATHTPEHVGDVKHLFEYHDSSNHSRYVAETLTVKESYPLLYTHYSTFSFELDSFHATTTSNLRAFLNDDDQIQHYPISSYDDVPLAPAKLLNISNTNGGSSDDLVRRFDKLVEENDIVACTAHSSLQSGNWTTSGMAYNSIVVEQKYGNVNAFDGAKVNDHGSPRYKPDITSRSAVSSATSWSSPQTCSAAAMLLERAKIDPNLSNAFHSIVIKSILMAGATRFNYRASVEWNDASPVDPLFWHGEWERESDEFPTSPKYGAGALNVFASYKILNSGEFDGGSDGDVGLSGWDYVRDLVEEDAIQYRLAIAEDSVFSAVLVWHRYIDDNRSSYLPDYELDVFDNDGNRVAFSDSTTSNVELVEVELQPGNYVMEVRVVSDDDSPDSLTYGLAWMTKELCGSADGLTVSDEDMSWALTWNEPNDSNCSKYRLQVRTGRADSDDIEADMYLDTNTHQYSKPADASSRYFRLYVYPHDGSVPFRYPSSAVRVDGE